MGNKPDTTFQNSKPLKYFLKERHDLPGQNNQILPGDPGYQDYVQHTRLYKMYEALGSAHASYKALRDKLENYAWTVMTVWDTGSERNPLGNRETVPKQ